MEYINFIEKTNKIMSFKILVVDDDEEILNVINTILTIYEFDCLTISDWKLLNDNINVFNPDLILLDINLIGNDGRSLCKDLKNNIRTANIPVILFSSDHIDPKTFKECNAVAFINKPFDVKYFLETLKKHLPKEIPN